MGLQSVKIYLVYLILKLKTNNRKIKMVEGDVEGLKDKVVYTGPN